MFTQSLVATFIRVIHILLVLFIIVVPFTNSEYFLTLHAIGIPGLIIHWVTNNNLCSLTLLESKLTGEQIDNTFIGKIVHPFFEINDYTIYTIVLGLWLISLYKLYPTRFRMLRLCFSITWQYLYNFYEWIKSWFVSEEVDI
jgi:hypothetical protein